MRKEKHSRSSGKEREKKEKAASVSRALSWLSGSSLSRQTRKLFRSHNDLSTLSRTAGQKQEDEDDWVYQPQHYIAVSNLDEESKWTVHYKAPWHQQENVFLPTSRPACVEELHREAKVNLKTALRECDKLRKDGFRSSQYYSQGPTFSGSNRSHSSQQEDEEDDEDDKSVASSAEEEKSSNSMRVQTPVQGQAAEVDGQKSQLKSMPLPTPEEKMRQQAKAVPTDIVPINITGDTFDRQASVRRSLINTDTLFHRPKKVKRRKTISGVPDNIQQELAGKGRELRPQSMFIPGHYSTLGRSGSMNSTLRHSDTRDSGCQTEEVKIVPPSVRRIRAQKGQGIAAQMSGISTSATNVSAVSDGDSSGSPMRVMAPRFNSNIQRFHSLPRGARVSLSSEPKYSSTPSRPEDNTEAAPRQIGKFQVDDTAVHMRNAPRISTSNRPKSQEVRGSQAEWRTVTPPACVVSPHAGYSTSLIPNAALSCSTEIIALHTASVPGQQSLPRPLRMASAVIGESSSSMATSAETEYADMRDTCQSDSSLHSHSTIAAGTLSSDEHWIYDTPENVLPRRTLTSSCSTPINQLYNSLERSSKGTDSSSLYSMDNDGYYTSMHLDSGLRPRSHSVAGRAVSMYECIGQPGDRSSIYSNQSLSRSISLRKSKKPPLPPARTDSLQRKPKNNREANCTTNATKQSILNESLIATLQQSLQNGSKGKGSLTSSSQSPCSDYEDPWMLRSRSQSSVSAGSSGVSAPGVANVYSICHVTPSQSETSSLRSDYESWGYYLDFPRLQGDQTQSPTRMNSVSSKGHSGRVTNGHGIHSGLQPALPPAQNDISAKPQANTSSPDRVHRLTSPSSGYSSQSNTPTAGTPVPSFMRSMSPSGSKPKPRVPERKSSLLSSVSISSSSTSLSSNTSDSLRNIPPPPPPLPLSFLGSSIPESFPPPLPPSNPACPTNENLPPPPAPDLPPTTPKQEASMNPLSVNSSPEFPPPPPPEMLNDFGVQMNGSFIAPLYPPPPPPPPALFHHTAPTVPSSASLKGIKDHLKPVNSVKRQSSINSEESGKSAVPLITPFALQSVQLRSVKRPENVGLDKLKSQQPEADQVSIKAWNNEHSPVSVLASCSVSDMKGALSPLIPENKFTKDDSLTEISLNNENSKKEMSSKQIHMRLNVSSNHIKDEVDGQDKEDRTLAESPQKSSPKKIPPTVSKKPRFPLVSAAAVESPTDENQTLAKMLDSETPSLQKQESEKKKYKSSSECSPSPDINASECSIPPFDGLVKDSFQNAVIQEPDFEVTSTSEGEEEDDRDDENGEVFESSAADSPQTPSTNGEVFQDMVTPTRPRTTEDLFAAIHRSKRKVLGRKESEDECLKSSSSPPVTPTGPSPVLTSSLPRQPSSIQRSLRKSATSSDTFKALLLKKGSRSEGSFRMSATEMLRTTDPRFQKTRSLDSSFDSQSPGESPCSSPSRNNRTPDDWPRSESMLSRYSLGSPLSPSVLGPKYSRSRTPPSAASSRYNARSRILSSPMTVICEREGELTESAEGLDEPSSVSPLVMSTAPTQDSSATLCEESG
ncbi:NHS-like protein 1 [Trichomycterus rosablanca]|uniref:NHS-like protein 1 n=1 Tax=Trichomycterus rosablanca TaxID=2290929 RepID=UPI002F35A03E